MALSPDRSASPIDAAGPTGMVVTTTVPASVDELIEGSDNALYRAKRAGRGTIDLVRWNAPA